MKRWFDKIAVYTRKLRTQLFLTYFIVFAFFFLAVFLLASGSIRDLMVDQIGNNRTAVLQQIAERADIVKTSSTTLSNLYSHEIESNGFLDSVLTDRQKEEAADYLNSRKKIYDEVFRHIGLGFEVVLMGANDFVYCSDGAGMDVDKWVYEPWFRYLRADMEEGAHGEVQFSRTFRSSTAEGTVYRFAAGKFLSGDGGRSILLILIDEKYLEELYASTQKQGGEIYIYDENGFIVSHSNKKMLGKQFIDVDYMRENYGTNQSSIIQKLGESNMLSTYLDERTGWTIVEVSPTGVILGALCQTYWMLGTLLVSGMLLAVAVSMYVSRHVSRPLSQLSDAMDKFGEQDFTPPAVKTGTQELDHLQDSFNHMAVEISSLMDIIREREEQKRVLEVNFLRAQINPHFLYNMLFSIRCAVEVGKSSQASEMLGAFIDLLRSTLDVKGTKVPLCDELETTRKYLVVQKLRYGEKINFEIEMQEGTEHCMVPPLILQPLVENAIFHGIEAKNEAGTVVIESALLGENLQITISDDGAGMDGETLAKVRFRYNQREARNAHSIGMSNVHNRIRVNFGEAYGLSVESEPGIGTTVTLIMPIVTEKEERHESSDRR